MARIDLDRHLFARQIRAKVAALDSARQCKMLEVYLEHTQAEIDGDVDRVMATMNSDCRFHTWFGGEEIGPKGWDAVKAMYAQMFATRSNYMEIDYNRIVVDNNVIVVEFTQRKLLPGENFVSGSLAEMLRAKGERADPSAYYLSKGRVVVMIPFDEQGRIIGEDSFTGGAAIRKLSDDELSEAYRAWL
jgi:hypothetical protein